MKTVDGLDVYKRQSLMFAFILAILLIYLILAAQFESFKDPLIIMLTAVSYTHLDVYKRQGLALSGLNTSNLRPSNRFSPS